MKYSSTCFLCLISQFPSSLRLFILTYPASYLGGIDCLVNVSHFQQKNITEGVTGIIFMNKSTTGIQFNRVHIKLPNKN